MKRILVVLLFVFFAALTASAKENAPDFSVKFAEYETGDLSLDVYMPSDGSASHMCIIYAYGGGFKFNNQKSRDTKAICRRFADDGFVAIAVDYRLGLKEVKMKSKLGMVKPLRNSIHMAAEDMIKAVAFVCDHASELKVDPKAIVLVGASAGAITSLQTDYELCNRTGIASILPEDFRLAGVISFAGAVYSTKGAIKYTAHAPAPTLMFHGIDDKVVTYKKIAFFSQHFGGSSDLVKTFKRNHYSHEIIRFVEEGHGVAGRELESYCDVVWFIDNMVKKGMHFEIDKTVYDREHKRGKWDKADTKSLY